MNSGKVVLGVLAGVAVGAALGILFAPDKGSKTRKQILSKGGDYADAIKDKLDEIVDSVTSNVEDMHKQADDLASKGKAKFDEVKKDVKQHATA